jgi:23S rRNA pseudouridine2605 synthase
VTEFGEAGEGLVPMRLQKFLARAGVASRRGSEDLMTAGRVTVNGVVSRELGTKVDPRCDEVAVDGRPVSLADGKVYLVLNKPAGYLTTMSDPYGRPTVAELVPAGRFPGLFPVGRLDQDTTGVLLFTTDGDLAARLLHPSTHVTKVYHALVDGEARDEDLDPLREGMELDDGPCAPAACRLLAADEAPGLCAGRLPDGRDLVEVVIHEGRKHQVKRMLSAVGHPVLRLVRVKFGTVDATGVDEGSWRMLTAAEVAALQEAVAAGSYTGTRRGMDPRSLKKK